MDGFKDRFTQHIATPEEIINANSQAEATQAEELKEQVEGLMDSLNTKLETMQTPEVDSTATLEAIDEKLKEIEEKLESHIHKENVRVYRNVQASLADEIGRINETIDMTLGGQVNSIGERLDMQVDQVDQIVNDNNRMLLDEMSSRMEMLSAMMNALNEQQKGQGQAISDMATRLNETKEGVEKAVKSRALLAIQIVMLILVIGDLAINVLLTLGLL